MIYARSLTAVQVTEINAEGTKLHILARTRNPINNNGVIEYEDLDGGIFPDRIALDVEHIGTDPIGRAYNFQITDKGLECDAIVYPNFPSPDRPLSNGILEQLARDIPLDASILFTIDDPTSIQYLTEGKQAEVNGLVVDGPCKIHREWRLRSITLCRVGADPGTKVDISRSEVFSMDENEAAKIKEEDVKETAPDVGKEVEEQETPAENDLDALLAIVAELQVKMNELEARIIALEAPEAVEEPAPVEEAPTPETAEVEALKSNVTMLRHQLLAVMRSNKATQPVGVATAEDQHDQLSGSIRYSMQGLN